MDRNVLCMMTVFPRCLKSREREEKVEISRSHMFVLSVALHLPVLGLSLFTSEHTQVSLCVVVLMYIAIVLQMNWAELEAEFIKEDSNSAAIFPWNELLVKNFGCDLGTVRNQICWRICQWYELQCCSFPVNTVICYWSELKSIMLWT